MTKKKIAQLNFASYQREALTTDQLKGEGIESMMVPLLGLAGEVGSLATEHKKRLRDKEKHRLFKERVEEDLGDILWYVANVASKSGLDLETIARKNLRKNQARWGKPEDGQLHLFDANERHSERIPRHFTIEFQVDSKGRVRLLRDGKRVGDPLTDNNYLDDGYRFHDVFHFSYAAVLGWSPVTRKLLGCKRRHDSAKDEVEDGGRAAVCEEGVAAFVYSYARTRDLLEDVSEIDFDILKSIGGMTNHLEVSMRTPADWERAILVGYRVWHELRAANGGVVTVDLEKRELFFATLPAKSRPLRPKTLTRRQASSGKPGLAAEAQRTRVSRSA